MFSDDQELGLHSLAIPSYQVGSLLNESAIRFLTPFIWRISYQYSDIFTFKSAILRLLMPGKSLDSKPFIPEQSLYTMTGCFELYVKWWHFLSMKNTDNSSSSDGHQRG